MNYDFYIYKNNHNLFEVRQTRFRKMFEEGFDHPHDICAMDRSVSRLKDMIGPTGFDWNVDWSGYSHEGGWTRLELDVKEN